jgi:hypothetical protein
MFDEPFQRYAVFLTLLKPLLDNMDNRRGLLHRDGAGLCP